MAKQNINVGTAANDKKGDSLRAAFQKVNANFTELYTELGLVNDVTLSLGAFEFAGSTISTTDSTAIVIDQATTITSNLSVGGDIVPQTANGGDLGSSTLPWRSLYVSNNTIYIGGVPLGLDASNNLTVNGSRVGTTSYADLSGKPALSTVTTTGAYADLTGKPTIPTLVSQLANDSGFLTSVGNISNIQSESDVSIQVNLTDSTTRIWRFGEDGDLTLPSTSGFIDRLYTDNGGSRTKLEKKIESSPTAGTIAKLELDLDNGHIRLAIGNYTGGNDQWIDTSTWAFRGDTGSLTLPPAGKIINNNKEWTFGTDGSLQIPGDIRSEGNINIDINLADSTLRRWQFGEDGALTLPSVGKISNGAYDWTFGSTGITTFPGVINAGNINNLVVNDLGGGTSLTAGSQVQIGNSAGIAGAGVLIKNAVTNILGGETSLEAGSKIQMDNGIVSLSGYTYTSIGDDTGLEFRMVVEVVNSYPNNVVRIGTRIINTGVEPPTNAFQGVTISQYGELTFPDATVQTTAYNPSNIRSEGNINIEVNLSDSTKRIWQFGEDGSLTLPSGNSVISNLNVVGNTSTGSQIQVGNGVAADTGIIISNGTTIDLGDGSVGSSGALVNVNGTTAAIINQAYQSNQYGSVAAQQLVEVSGTIFIGTKNISVSGNETTTNLDGWTFDSGPGTLTFPDGTVQTTAAGTYQFSVAADDSTQRVISTDEVIKFVGAGGITTASDAEGNITINYVQGDIRSDSNINIDINLADSTLRRWQFGEDGNLAVPGDINLSGGTISQYSQNGLTGLKLVANADQGQNVTIMGTGNNTFPILNYVGTTLSGITIGTPEGDWNFMNGNLTIPGDIKSNGNINIDINLSDSTLRRWQFGEDGDLTFPDGTSQSTAGGTWPVTNTAGSSGPTKVAIGRYAGDVTQGSNAVAIGNVAGYTGQVAGAVAIGWQAGETTQGGSAVAIGNSAGNSSQGASAVAVGLYAGYTNQGVSAVAIGAYAGNTSQGTYSVAVGLSAGATSQGNYTVAVGLDAGGNTQGESAVAVGTNAGNNSQGTYSVAVGYAAGQTSQAANTIILNATGSTVNGVAAQTNSFYVAPIRNASGTDGVLQYNTTTKEVSYSNNVTAETFNTDQITLVGNRLSTTVTNANLELECNGTGGVVINTLADATTASTVKSVGYLGLPQSGTATTATLAIGDAGKHIYITTTGQTITIPAAASVAYPIGTTITFIAGSSATTTTIAITSDTLRLAGGTSTGSRTLAANGMATAVKVSGTSSAGVWYINGTGLT